MTKSAVAVGATRRAIQEAARSAAGGRRGRGRGDGVPPLGLAGAAGASSPAPAASASPGATIYRVGLLEYVDSLNPFVGYTGVNYTVYHLNYDFLVGFEPQKLQPRPEYAESWSSSADGLTWTFKIRPGMKWQDGQPATAHDAAFTFDYILENDLSAFTGYLRS